MYYGRQIKDKEIIGYISSSTPLPYDEEILIQITQEEYDTGCQQIDSERKNKIIQNRLKKQLEKENIELIEPNLPFEIQDEDIELPVQTKDVIVKPENDNNIEEEEEDD